VVPVVQATPQLFGFVEQWALSFSGFAQTPLHNSWPGGQSSWQLPLTHSSPGSQTVPQLPQWFGSVNVSTHEPPQFIVLLGQVVVLHDPLLQTSSGPQSLPQAPQFSWSVGKNTQSPLQSVSPPAVSQTDEQLPPLQTGLEALVLQFVPQSPQCVLSVLRSTH
jgi:hypothetical protein